MNKTWTREEMIKAIDAHLDGHGLTSVMEERSFGAVENLLFSDLPRNYRNCVGKLEGEGEAVCRRAWKPWTLTESKYLQMLRKKKLIGTREIMVILGRTEEEIAKHVETIEYFHKGPGFFQKETF